MADKRTEPGAPEAARRGKRAAPTIDLKATEVKPSPVAGKPQPQAAAEPPAAPPPPPPEPEQPRAGPDNPPPAGDSATSATTPRGLSHYFTAPTLAAGVAGAVAAAA